MVGIRSGLVCGFLIFLGILFANAGSATAQTTINQTTCSPVANCQTGGNLQTISVNCTNGDRISTALNQIADRNGPNRINILGTCSLESVTIAGFNRLTIDGSGGATITRSLSILNSRGILLRNMGFNFTGAPAGSNLGFNGSQVNLDGVFLTAAQNAGISVGASTLFFQGAPSTITGNNGPGIRMTTGAHVTAVNVTIANNSDNGIYVGANSTLAFGNNLGGTPAPVDISNNSGAGVKNEGGAIISAGMGGPTLVRIHNNFGAGIDSGGGSAVITGSIQLDNNQGDDDFGAQFVAIAGVGVVGEGVNVQGGIGTINSMLITSGSITVTGEVSLFGNSLSFVSGTGSINTLTCDSTSWVPVVEGVTLGTNNCPTSGPTGTQGPQGPQGPAGPPGPAGTANGTVGYLGRFSDSTTVGNSAIFQTPAGRVGINTTAPAAPFHSVATETPGAFFDVYNNSLVALPVVFRAARGTPAAPAPVQADDILGGLAIRGYAPSGFTPGKGQVMFKAAENWTDTANGTYLQFTTTPIGQTAFSERMRIDATGRIGIGTSTPGALLHVAGNAIINGTITSLNQDVAEWVESGTRLAPGTIVIVDPNAVDGVRPSSRAYDTAVAGAISSQPGVALGSEAENKSLVAQSGRVRIKVDASYGAIRPGDLLVTSPTPGHAMVAKPGRVKPGMVLGKALEPLAKGRGEVLALLTLQ